MKVGKVPVAAIVLLIIGIIGYVMRHFYASQYAANSSFIDGAFFGATLVYLLYYVNIYYTAWANNRKAAKKNPTL